MLVLDEITIVVTTDETGYKHYDFDDSNLSAGDAGLVRYFLTYPLDHSDADMSEEEVLALRQKLSAHLARGGFKFNFTDQLP